MTNEETMKLARQIIWRYRHETPFGNQPHMIAHEADEAIERIDQALAKQEHGEPVAKQRPFTKQQRDSICMIYAIATGSTTINSLPHIAKIANQLLTEDVYAQPKQEQGEPVAYANDDWSRIDFPSGKVPTKGGPIYTTSQPKQEQGDPVAWTLTETLEKKETTTTGRLWFSNPQNSSWTPLYTTPQQRKPLTDEQIWQLVNDCTIGGDLHADKFAREIEAAIKE